MTTRGSFDLYFPDSLCDFHMPTYILLLYPFEFSPLCIASSCLVTIFLQGCLFLKKNFFYIFSDLLHWVLVLSYESFVAAHRFSSCDASSVVVTRGISCSSTCGILVPQPGIKPVSPALQGRFLTTGPPGKSLIHIVVQQTLTQYCKATTLKKKKKKMVFWDHSSPGCQGAT